MLDFYEQETEKNIFPTALLMVRFFFLFRLNIRLEPFE